MNVVGYIERVTEVPEGYKLELCGHAYDQGYSTIVTAGSGQPSLTILRPTWSPEVGMVIWGGSDYVIIEATTCRRYYRRVGYTRLEEVIGGPT